ncbi:MAG: VIT1/CCC1 transporter family protein, partial [Pseudomonadota bacterium]|nr:VIT1/CCC1 transporter family protein [Pseudomonadota bacterium]
QVLSDKNSALDTLAREELGINPENLGGSPWSAAASSFLLFIVGAIIPLIPFIFTQGMQAVSWSIIVSGLALFIIGALITLFTGRHVLFSGLRQLCLGFIAALITFGIGHFIGVVIGS